MRLHTSRPKTPPSRPAPVQPLPRPAAVSPAPVGPQTPARYLNRERHIVARARGKRVLHLGCVGSDNFGATEDRVNAYHGLLHARLSAVADVTGVDLAADVVEEYRRRGYCDNILVGSVEELDRLELEGPYDLIVAGDTIEHVSNPGLMLEGIARLADERTEVILTTPNAHGLPNFLRFALGRFQDGAEHVLNFNAQNLCQLLGRHGFAVRELYTCHQERAMRERAFRPAAAVLRRWPKFGGTLYVVAQKAAPTGRGGRR